MEAPIRVAQVMGKMNGGGVEVVVMNYYRHTDRARIQFDFIVDEDSQLCPQDEVESLGGRVIKVPPYQKQPANSRYLEQLFRNEHYQIVHAHLNTLSVFSLRAAKRVGVPVRIAHSHSTWGKGEFGKNVVKAVLRTQINRYPTHRLACSTYAGTWLFGKAEFSVMNNAIALDDFNYMPEERRKLRHELGIADSTFVIGHIGRFMRQKNHEFLLQVFAKFLSKHPDALLLLIGEGELKGHITEMACTLGIESKVRFLGQRDDVNRLYSAFDVFCLPSLYEGLGIVGVEAQRSGISCLFSDQITREVGLSDDSQFLPIHTGAEHIWLEALEQKYLASDYASRHTCFDDRFKSYDITDQALWLADYYLEILQMQEMTLIHSVTHRFGVLSDGRYNAYL